MGAFEKLIISVTKKKMKGAFHSGEVQEISCEGLKEYRDIPYTNNAGKEVATGTFTFFMSQPEKK